MEALPFKDPGKKREKKAMRAFCNQRASPGFARLWLPQQRCSAAAGNGIGLLDVCELTCGSEDEIVNLASGGEALLEASA